MFVTLEKALVLSSSCIVQPPPTRTILLSATSCAKVARVAALWSTHQRCRKLVSTQLKTRSSDRFCDSHATTLFRIGVTSTS